MDQNKVSRVPFNENLTGLIRRIKLPLGNYRFMLTSWRFWSALGFILILEIIHESLEDWGLITGLGVLYFIPISFYWVPIVFAASNFGTAGSVAISLWIFLISVPNWMLWHHSEPQFAEAVMIFIAVLTALVVGRLADQKVAAQKDARIYAAHAIHYQEEMLSQLSRDIHDETIQTLVGACQGLDAVEASSANLNLKETRDTIEQAIKSLRNVIKKRRPPLLDDFGLVTATRRLSTDLASKTGIDSEFKVIGEERRVPADVELELYRIAQEALNNVERHAKAKHIVTIVTFSNKRIKLEIIDDGVGFRISQLYDNSGDRNNFGLIGMRERAEILDGKIDIESFPGKGTRVKAIIPTE